MKLFIIFSSAVASAALCLGESLFPTPTEEPFATVTLGENAAPGNWQLFSLEQAPIEVPPELLAKLDLKARSLELNARAAGDFVVAASSCSGNTCVNQGVFTLTSGKKTNFNGPSNLIVFSGGAHNCHMTLYEEFNEQQDGNDIQVTLLTSQAQSQAVSLTPRPATPTSPAFPGFARSVGYFC